MELQGTHKFDADPKVIWHALFDPKALITCVPGAKRINGSIRDGFTAEVETHFGPMTIAFQGEISVVDMTPFQSVSLKGKSRGLADIMLEKRDGKTLLSYHVSVTVGGRFGRLGEGVVTSFAKSMVDTFFAELEQVVVNA
ncbi:MAG: SRPBCC domain-containing protein [Pseudomonadota bacterium]